MPTRRQRGETCVTTKRTTPPRRSRKTIFVALRREPLRTQVRVVCSLDTGRTMGAKTTAAARSSALKRVCSAGVGAAEAAPGAEPVAVPPEPEPVFVPEVVVTFDAAEETIGVAEVVVWAGDDVTLLTVETTVDTIDVGFGGGGGGGRDDDEVGSGTLVLVGSGTVVDVGSGTLVLVGSGTEVLVGSGTVVSIARAVGAAIAAAAAQRRIDFGLRSLICGYNPASGRTVAARRDASVYVSPAYPVVVVPVVPVVAVVAVVVVVVLVVGVPVSQSDDFWNPITG